MRNPTNGIDPCHDRGFRGGWIFTLSTPDDRQENTRNGAEPESPENSLPGTAIMVRSSSDTHEKTRFLLTSRTLPARPPCRAHWNSRIDRKRGLHQYGASVPS